MGIVFEDKAIWSAEVMSKFFHRTGVKLKVLVWLEDG